MAKTTDNNTSQITIPVNLKLLLRAGREYRPLRLFVIRFCKENEIAGFTPYKVNFIKDKNLKKRD